MNNKQHELWDRFCQLQEQVSKLEKSIQRSLASSIQNDLNLIVEQGRATEQYIRTESKQNFTRNFEMVSKELDIITKNLGILGSDVTSFLENFTYKNE